MKIEITHYNKEHPEFDEIVIKEVPREYSCVAPDMKNAIVLDIGGNIGCFSALAINSGCKKVVYVEPTTPCFGYAAENLQAAVIEGYCEMHHAGITGTSNLKELTLRYFADGASMPRARTMVPNKAHRDHWRGRPYTYEKVPAVFFGDLLERYIPSVIKLDCEGAEYDCLLNLEQMPSYVKTIMAEFHDTAKEDGINKYLACVEKLTGWGFVQARQPNLTLYRYNDKVFGSNQFAIRPIPWRRS